MEDSLTNFDISASTVKINLDSSNSDQSDNFEELVGPDENITTEKAKTESENTEHDEIKHFDENLPETVTLLKHPNGAKVYLVGTAHFSKQSQDEVVHVMRTVKPHVAMLELCDSRTVLLTLDEETMLAEAQTLNLDNIRQLIKKNGLYCGLTYILILNLNKHITKEIGMAPGGEFRVAYQEAMDLQNCSVILGDRPIKITLMRALSKLSWWQTAKFAFNLLFSKETINKEDVENCKKKDMLEQLLAEMATEYPALGEVFVKERDIFLTYSLQEAASNKKLLRNPNEPPRVVGVVGIGHMLGMSKLWDEPQAPNIARVMVIPPPSLSSKILQFTIKVSFYALAGYLVVKYVPVPKTVRKTAENGFYALLEKSQATLLSISNNVKVKYDSILHR